MPSIGIATQGRRKRVKSSINSGGWRAGGASPALLQKRVGPQRQELSEIVVQHETIEEAGGLG